MGDDGEIADVGNGDGRHGRGIPLTSPCGNHIAVFSGPFFTPSWFHGGPKRATQRL